MPPSIRLLRIDSSLATAVAGGDEAFTLAYGARLGEARAVVEEIVSSSLGYFEQQGEPWGGFLAADTGSGQVVATGGFKGRPDRDGGIEIAYFTFPPFERQGYATALASSLVELAVASPDVRLIIAHTLPEENASTRVLTSIGMRFVGETVDPEDGTVWRWERGSGQHLRPAQPRLPRQKSSR